MPNLPEKLPKPEIKTSFKVKYGTQEGGCRHLKMSVAKTRNVERETTNTHILSEVGTCFGNEYLAY